eukprot:GFUD01025751.1.p1 GENE.GFUD01025751.1~~GFUD01025751.1.p1  ORF type:complete len:363 (+),score=91.37 GFUD01025751.1:86-1090(+)
MVVIACYMQVDGKTCPFTTPNTVEGAAVGILNHHLSFAHPPPAQADPPSKPSQRTKGSSSHYENEREYDDNIYYTYCASDDDNEEDPEDMKEFERTSQTPNTTLDKETFGGLNQRKLKVGLVIGLGIALLFGVVIGICIGRFILKSPDLKKCETATATSHTPTTTTYTPSNNIANKTITPRLSNIEKKDVEVSCSSAWSLFHGHCYTLLSDYNDIEMCREDCSKGEGVLASIHGQKENEFVASLIMDRSSRWFSGGVKNTWIAGSITKVGGDFTWMDGSNWDYENWDLDEPSRKSEGKEDHECVFMGNNPEDASKWVDGVCKWTSSNFDCVCKK